MGTIGVAVILVFFGLFEDPLGLFNRTKRRNRADLFIEFGSLGAVVIIITPAVIFLTAAALSRFLPGQRGMFSGLRWALALPLCLVSEDIIQYFYHRSAHAVPFLWRLHRSHHTAPSMGVFVSYRNGFLYYVLMPNFWWNGVLAYWGLGGPLALALIAKQLVVAGAHSSFKWDRWLYRDKRLAPLAWLVERVIVTPACHHGHHGRTAADGISNPNGNFGNMFFLWDTIFGTAKFSRAYPTEFGVDDGIEESWARQLLYPLPAAMTKMRRIFRKSAAAGIV